MIIPFAVINLVLNLNLYQVDFAICTAIQSQQTPTAIYSNSQFYAFWRDCRFYSTDSEYCIYGARIAEDGTVIDPDGKLQFKRQADIAPSVDYDGAHFLVVFRDSC